MTLGFMSDLMADLSDLIDDLAPDLLPDTCTIYGVATTTTDEYGNTTETTETIATDVPCYVRALTAQEQMLAGGLQANGTAVCMMRPSQTIQSDYTITVNARDVSPQRALKVVGPLPSPIGQGLKVLVTEG